MTEATRDARRRPILGTLAVRTLDVLLVVGWTWSVAVLVTGGWEWRARFGLVRATTASSVIYASAVLTVLRYCLAEWLTNEGEAQGIASLQRRLDRLSARLASFLQQLMPGTGRRVLVSILVACGGAGVHRDTGPLSRGETRRCCRADGAHGQAPGLRGLPRPARVPRRTPGDPTPGLQGLLEARGTRASTRTRRRLVAGPVAQA